MGNPENIRVIRSPYDDFSNEAIRILKDGPKWNPAMNNGLYSEEEIRIKILFEK